MRTLRIGFLAACAALISNGCQSARPPEPVVPATHELAPPPRLAAAAPATTESHYQALANSAMRENRPTAETVRSLKDELLFQRATQVYLWAMPLLNVLGMKTGSEKLFEAGYNVLPVWKNRVDAKALVTTPNSDVIYAMSYLDLGKDGPLVFEAAAGLQGILLDFWQRPLPGPPAPGKDYRGDVGFFGPDQGRGGKYLILPPGYKERVPEGYFVFRSQTNNVFVFLRSFYTDPKDLAPAVAVMDEREDLPAQKQSQRQTHAVPGRLGCPSEPLAAERRECVSVTQALRRQ